MLVAETPSIRAVHAVSKCLWKSRNTEMYSKQSHWAGAPQQTSAQMLSASAGLGYFPEWGGGRSALGWSNAQSECAGPWRGKGGAKQGRGGGSRPTTADAAAAVRLSPEEVALLEWRRLDQRHVPPYDPLASSILTHNSPKYWESNLAQEKLGGFFH